ncbi:MAG: hypothetical protein LWW95_11200 [Candidatus Desulfofervidus auxilii]|nr:hypothetical protein [Candidatus Desulfofervidus auxilii]
MKKRLFIFLLFSFSIISLVLLQRYDSKPINKLFSYSWGSFNGKARISVILELDDVRILNEPYIVKCTLRIDELGNHKYIYISYISLEIGIGEKVTYNIDKMFKEKGDILEFNFTFKPREDSLIKPGKMYESSISIDIDGYAVDKSYDFNWGLYFFEYFDIYEYAYKPNVSILFYYPTNVTVFSPFNFTVEIINKGETKIKDIEVKIISSYIFEILGNDKYETDIINPGDINKYTFELKPKYSEGNKVNIYITYSAETGYRYYKSYYKYIYVSKANSSITCQANKDEISEGDEIVVSGKLTPSMREMISIIITDPDGNVDERIVFTNSLGEYSYQLSLNKAGKWRIKAYFKGSSEYLESTSNEIIVTVKEKITYPRIDIIIYLILSVIFFAFVLVKYGLLKALSVACFIVATLFLIDMLRIYLLFTVYGTISPLVAFFISQYVYNVIAIEFMLFIVFFVIGVLLYLKSRK